MDDIAFVSKFIRDPWNVENICKQKPMQQISDDSDASWFSDDDSITGAHEELATISCDEYHENNTDSNIPYYSEVLPEEEANFVKSSTGPLIEVGTIISCIFYKFDEMNSPPYLSHR